MPITHVLTIVAVHDLATSARFYELALGWPRSVDTPAYVEFRSESGPRLGVYERTAFARNTGQVPEQVSAGQLTATELYFYADDLQAAVDQLLAAGARALSALAPRPWGDEAAYFADPDGNVVVVARVMDGR